MAEYNIINLCEDEDEEIDYKLHVAAANGYKDEVVRLLEIGEPIDVPTAEDKTPLLLAIENRHYDVVRLLLQEGANVHLISKDGYSPLHCAVKLKDFSAVEILVKHGADINVRDVDRGYSPLHLAVIYYNEAQSQLNSTSTLNSNIRIIEFLLENGADINIRNWDNETPLHCAARRNQTVLIRLLFERGAESDIESSDGDTPLDLVSHHTVLFVFIKHIALHNQNVKSRKDTQYSAFVNCKIELQKMKNTILDNDISWYTFLTQNDENRLEAYLCNDNIRMQLLESEYYKKKFRLYKAMLESQIKRAQNRFSLTQNVINYFYSQLPVECLRKIISYLSTKDLENFVNIIYKKSK